MSEQDVLCSSKAFLGGGRHFRFVFTIIVFLVE